MKTGYVVADVMTTKPVTCTKKTSLLQCAQTMKQHAVGSLLIVERGALIGIFTDTDFVYKVAAEELPLSSPVEKVMSTALYTTTPATDIVEAVQVMNKYNIRHLPVMEDKKLVGYLTLKTILKIEPQLFELLSEKIELRGISPESSLLGDYDEELSEGLCESCGNYSSKLIEIEGQRICKHCLNN